jgi:hypothetical protein
MLYLGYGLEFSLPGLIAEGLAQAAVHKVASSALLPRKMFDASTHRSGTHAFSILSRIIRDRRFSNSKGSFDAVQSKLTPTPQTLIPTNATLLFIVLPWHLTEHSSWLSGPILALP